MHHAIEIGGIPVAADCAHGIAKAVGTTLSLAELRLFGLTYFAAFAFCMTLFA